MQQDQKMQAVAATFVTFYYRCLVTDPTLLFPIYTPRAQFKHDNKASCTVGAEAIKNAIKTLYPHPKRGRILITSLEFPQRTSKTFVFVVKAKFFPAPTVLGEQGPVASFRHFFELEDHEDGETFGLYSDVLNWDLPTAEPVQPSHPAPPVASTATAAPKTATNLSWSEETPPMFAQPPPAEEVPPIEEVPEEEAQEEEMCEPTIESQNAPTTEQHEEEKVETEEVPQQELEKVQVAAPSEEPRKAPMSFADMIRAKQGMPVVSKQPDEAKTKQPLKRETSEEEKNAKKAREPKEEAPVAVAPKKTGNPVVFYNAFVKGLPSDATVEDVCELLNPHVPIIKDKIKLESKPDARDPKLIRTFAFVLFDTAQLREGQTIKSVLDSLMQIKLSLRGYKVILDEVREKYIKKPQKKERGGA